MRETPFCLDGRVCVDGVRETLGEFEFVGDDKLGPCLTETRNPT
jgi:hypothetical protein